MNDLVLISLTKEQIRQIVKTEVMGSFNSAGFHPDKDAAFVSISKAAKLIDVSRPTIYEMINEGILNKYKIKGISRIKVVELIDSAEVAS